MFICYKLGNSNHLGIVSSAIVAERKSRKTGKKSKATNQPSPKAQVPLDCTLLEAHICIQGKTSFCGPLSTRMIVTVTYIKQIMICILFMFNC